MAKDNFPPFSAHFDANQTPTIMGVVGTQGTADINGTAQPLPYGVDPATGAMYVNILAGAGAASNPTNGTLSTLGTVGTILGIGGTVQVAGASAGTNVNVVTGTINVGTFVHPSGTVTTIVAGTQNTLGTVGQLNAGSIAVTAGTIVGTFLELSGSATAGTVDIIASTDVSNYRWWSLQLTNTFTGTVNFQVSNDNVNFVNANVWNISNTSAPSTSMTVAGIFAGPIEGRYTRVRMNAFTSGTSQGLLELNSTPTSLHSTLVQSSQSGAYNVTGTIANGTINVNKVPVVVGTSLTTVGTTGVAVWGTLVAASGAGTKQYVSGVDIVVTSGTVDVAVTNIGIGGSTGAGVLARGQFIPGGGIAKTFDPVQASGTNGTLSYWLGGAGTVAITAQYWNGV